jgi:hypothetical protein
MNVTYHIQSDISHTALGAPVDLHGSLSTSSPDGGP